MLDLAPEHIRALDSLDLSQAGSIRKDPFDRMLIAQANAERKLLLTHDEKLGLYSEPLVIVV